MTDKRILRAWLLVNIPDLFTGRWELRKPVVEDMSISINNNQIRVTYSPTFGPYPRTRFIRTRGEFAVTQYAIEKAWKRNVVPSLRHTFDNVELEVTKFSGNNKSMRATVIITMSVRTKAKQNPWSPW